MVLRAQTSGGAGYGGIGDPAVSPGSPSSSYAVTGIEHINYYNGLVNIAIPTYTVAGRGSTSVPVVIGIQRQWSVNSPNTPTTSQTEYSISFFGPGGTGTPVIYPISVAANPNACPQDLYSAATGPFTTYLLYTAPDGTQTVLHDLVYNGQPQGSSACPPQPQYADRGRIFQSSDGTNLTFISNNDIMDGYPNGVVPPFGGLLITRDGTRYTIGPTGLGTGISGVEDRNGNAMSFSGQTDSSTFTTTYTAVDSLGRTEHITVPCCQPASQTISYPGAGGVTRTITANYTNLSSALAPGESKQGLAALFPELTGTAIVWSADTQRVLSSVVLADGTSTYTLQYNSYGEVARVTLPTGGVYVYKYPEAYAGTGDGVIALSGGGYNINRRLLERDEYADGLHLSGKMLFSTTSQQTGLDPNNPSRPGILITITFQDAASNTLRVEKHYFYGNPASTDPDPANPTQFADWWLGVEFKTEVWDGSGKIFQSEQRVYTQRPCGSGENCWYSPLSDSAPAHDPQLCQVNTSNDAGQVSGVVYQYDAYNNQTDAYEFGYGAAPAVTASCPTALSAAARHTHTTFAAGAYVASNVNILGLPVSTSVSDGAGTQYALTNFYYDQQSPSDAPGIVGHDANYGTGFNTRGNLTSIQRWWSYNGSYPSQSLAYDIAGNVLTATDPNSHITRFSYNDDGQNKYAFATSVKNALNQVRSARYDYNIGRPTSSTDLNNKTAYYTYADTLDRLTKVQLPNGGYSYYSYPNPNTVIAQQDQNTSGDAVLKSQVLYDGLGRAVESDTFESASQYIAVTTSYDALGRVRTKTNPSRPGDGLNYATTYSYDALGRTTAVTTPDGAVATTAYAGSQTTATDQAGKQKQYTEDAFGRLTNVLEDPAGLKYATSYQYDILDDLKLVTQGSQTRSFSYDSLKRLTGATNPESGTVQYTYDAAGNPKTKTDPRSVTINYGYDALNRITVKTYPSGTPNVTYTYDATGAENGIGHLTGVSAANGVATNYTAFDSIGNLVSSTKTIGANVYGFSYAYNLARSLVRETYPSGRVATTTYDGANRPSTLKGTLSGVQTNYITQAGYWPHALKYFVRGNTLWYNQGYNNRLQLSETYEAINNSSSNILQVSCLNWGVQPNFGASLFAVCPVSSTTNDNGNLQSVLFQNGGPGYPQFLSFTQTFGYDSVNRLSFASDTGGWSRKFAYDQYANMWVYGSSGIPLAGNTPTSNVYTAANQISGAGYDAAGNQLSVNGDTAAYDAENRQVSVTEPPSMGGGAETLVYDGNGRRVQKILPSGTTNYVYDDFGRLIAEYSTNPAQAPCWTCYLSYDHLGSVRMVTSGNLQFIARHDFLPFGEEIPPNSAGRNSQWGAANDNVIQKFTGQPRDSETGLDYFNARYFGAALGIFTSPDPANAGANPANPQSWNAYAYVLGNPLANTDLTGMDTNYAGIQQGFCPASKANCPMPGQPVVGRPTVPNEIDEAEARYVQEVVIPGFKGQAPSLISYAPVNAVGYATSEAIFYGDPILAKIKQTSAEMVTTSNFGNPAQNPPTMNHMIVTAQPTIPQQKQTGTYAAYAGCLIGAMPKVLFTSAFGVGLTAAAGRSYSNPIPPPEGNTPTRVFEPGLKWGVKGQVVGSIVFLATYEVQLNAAANSCSTSTGYTPWVLEP